LAGSVFGKRSAGSYNQEVLEAVLVHYVLIGGFFIVAAPTAVAQTPYQTCATQLAEASRCGSCNSLWTEFLRQCVPQVYPQMSPSALDACIAEVEQKDQKKPLGWDREGDVLACLEN
jgi:hypothetical protein